MKLHYRSYGSGEPLIILHGLFGSLNNWHTLAGKLGVHFHVFSVDQRNHGESPHTDALSYALMAADLLEFMHLHRIAAAHLLGHSMGGKTAMEFALQHPEMVDRLVVVDIAPRAYKTAQEEIMSAMESVDLSRYRTRGEIERALEVDVPESRVRQFILTNLKRRVSGLYEWKINLPALRASSSEIGKPQESDNPFPRPALFLEGGKSAYILPEDHSLILRLFPEASFRTIQGAGHWIHAEAPEEFLRIVLSFLSPPAIL
jgi:pimeloyl-ACP methyl ester carboxylesterase